MLLKHGLECNLKIKEIKDRIDNKKEIFVSKKDKIIGYRQEVCDGKNNFEVCLVNDDPVFGYGKIWLSYRDDINLANFRQ